MLDVPDHPDAYLLPGETVAERRACRHCTLEFPVGDSDLGFYRKMGVPPPTVCPRCRMRRRLSFRNDRTLFPATSAKSGERMISMYDPTFGLPVYAAHEWWADDWNPLDHGIEYASGVSFFDQFLLLMQRVPRFNLFNRSSENCDFVNYAPHCKDCYLVFGSWFSERCLYGQSLFECRSCFDNLFLLKGELCLENTDCAENYSSVYCSNCTKAVDCAFCFDCRNISNCIGCYNLHGVRYHIRNVPVTEAEYVEARRSLASRARVLEWIAWFDHCIVEEAVHKSITGFGNERVTGDFIFRTQNAKWCFSAYESQDVAYSSRIERQKDTYDYEGGGRGELVYEGMSNDFAYGCVSCMTSEHLKHCHYCDLCFNCSNCFGCIGLRRKEYCILNRQYSKAEYEQTMKRIVDEMTACGEWGEFFPAKLSPHAYNHTLAHEYLPLARAAAETLGYRFAERAAQSAAPTAELPPEVSALAAGAAKEIYGCTRCSKSYRLNKAEIEFYAGIGVAPVPFCPDCRHAIRFARRHPRSVLARECSRCGMEVLTACTAVYGRKVYCGVCYDSAVYGGN